MSDGGRGMSTDAADRQGTSQKQQETAKFPGYERGRLAARSACALAEGREGSFIGCNADRDAQRRTPLAADGLEFTGEHNRPRRVPRLLVGGCFRRGAGERNRAAFVYDEVTIDRHGGLVPNSSRRSLDVTYDIQNDAVLGPAFDYWQTKRGRRAMPRRQDIDPTEIPHCCPICRLPNWPTTAAAFAIALPAPRSSMRMAPNCGGNISTRCSPPSGCIPSRRTTG